MSPIPAVICVQFNVVFLSFPVRFFNWPTNTPYVQHVDRGGKAQKLVEGPVPNPMLISHWKGSSSAASEHPIFEAFGIVERFVESEDRTL